MRRVRHKNISGLTRRVQSQVGTAMLQWGHTVASMAEERAPIDTGALRRAVTNGVSRVQMRGDTLIVRVGPDTTVRDYAEQQEFDTSLGFGPKSRAEGATRPWLRPAFMAARSLGRALVRAAFKRAI